MRPCMLWHKERPLVPSMVVIRMTFTVKRLADQKSGTKNGQPFLRLSRLEAFVDGLVD